MVASTLMYIHFFIYSISLKNSNLACRWIDANKYGYVIKECQNISQWGRLPLRVESERF